MAQVRRPATHSDCASRHACRNLSPSGPMSRSRGPITHDPISHDRRWLGGFLWYLVPVHVGGATLHWMRGHSIFTRIVPGLAK